ncbi:signal peptidase I [Vallitalea pronyensis]|uniref:Signal peptidase I n=1 Tax=Vallitalea pronyensis TaxID=1348613 RepID=A0A8J8MGX8_9FIRM|nr:signal peptidase I [Vallitalea pronyensis]QUI21038.1 signal peptidase I [Vallitalea pronyensis]
MRYVNPKEQQNIQLILFVLLCVFVYFIPRWTHGLKLRHRSFVIWWAFIFGFFYLIIQGLAGLFFSFGKSPFDQHFLSILKNCFTFGLPLICRELVRSYCINGNPHGSKIRTSILLIGIFTILEFTLSKYSGITTFQEFVMFLGQYFLPSLCKQTLLTLFAFLAGPVPAIIYSLMIEFPPYILPILPDLNWLVSAFIGILTPIFSIIVLQALAKKELKQPVKAHENENPLTLTITIILSIVIIWFASGVFSIYPSVIATGSMEPMIYPGDVILVQKINEKNIQLLKEGDVIQFQRGDILISHRIIELVHEHQQVVYRTKGDNNSSEDSELVTPENVKGIIKHVIPKIGWPTLILKQNNDVDTGDLEF